MQKKSTIRILPVCLAVSLAPVTPASFAARPMVTDDARVVDAGACQLETWRRFNRDSSEWWALPACNPGGNLEITLGSARLPVEDAASGDYTRTVQIQGKTLFKTLEAGGYGYGLVAGGVVRSQGAADQVPNYYAYMPYSRSFGDDAVVAHVNLGAHRIGAEPRNSFTYGLGAEIRLLPRLLLIVETFGDSHTRQSYHGGTRIWLVPGHIQLDATAGVQAGDMGASRWFTVGLRLISSALFK
jgi:hypothetical protein